MADVGLSETPAAVDEPPSERRTQADAPTEDANAAADQAATSGLAACADAVARADAAVAAARTALGNWKTHYGAQLALDRGAIDGDEAKRRWAVSKAPATDNLGALAAARDTMPAGAPCRGLADAQPQPAQRRLARSCAARMTAAPDVLSAADPSLHGWRDHLEMMATKDEYTIERYLRIWPRAVDAAPAPMRAFAQAADSYADLAPCDRGLAVLDRPDGLVRGGTTPKATNVLDDTGRAGPIEAFATTSTHTRATSVALRCRPPARAGAA